MAKRRKKAKINNTLVLLWFSILFVAFGWSLIRNADIFGRILLSLAFFCIPVLCISFVLYRRWKRMQRLRMLKIEDIDAMPGHFFEQYVARIMEHQGYQAMVTKGSGDLGVDIVASKNGVRYAVQCKRYGNNVPRTAISDAVAGKHHYNCTHAMVVTNQYFTPGAIELAKSTQCILVNRDILAAWVAQFCQKQRVKLTA